MALKRPAEAPTEAAWGSVDDPWNGLVVGLARIAEDVGGDHVALVLADVGQRPEPVDVPDRPQPLRRPQVGVDGDPVGVGLDADGLEPDTAHPRPPAGGDEQAVAPQFAAVVELEDVLVAVAAGGARVCGEDELDLVAAQDLAERLAQRRRLAREDVLGHVDDHGLAPEAANRLGHLHPDRPAAEDQEAARNRRHRPSPRGCSRRRRAPAGPAPAA